ncbi:NADH-quinone oxidoreductase subunit A [Lignipirellula cremea]|uniref:NADH-quinone oxidoreductase subunit n=1 Tax=Lignipirellula cremea TaxID=2528010 RepID=A0A518DUT8_9BACT|nr:NADH-quinone oxidoreductase subunit A [Lignipirellula cremea]QDU95601.1 NAD(P)H-quinone oxidoreductase subunit 3 [Lignipirellula cremea]
MEALGSSLSIVAYLALFCSVGLIFVFANLLIGYLVRPSDPHAEKEEIYECGEPTIGSSYVQFDLRFYVVALLFIIFDVEVAFFFPWATVFGKADHLSDQRFAVVAADTSVLTPQAIGLYKEFGVREPALPESVPPTLAKPFNQKYGKGAASAATLTPEQAADVCKLGGRQLMLVTLVDILVFFAVLMVGFAYVWKRGDLNWVRAVTDARSQGAVRTLAPEEVTEQDPVLTA